MTLRRRMYPFLTLFLVLALLLAACERPLRDTPENSSPNTVESTDAAPEEEAPAGESEAPTGEETAPEEESAEEAAAGEGDEPVTDGGEAAEGAPDAEPPAGEGATGEGSPSSEGTASEEGASSEGSAGEEPIDEGEPVGDEAAGEEVGEAPAEEGTGESAPEAQEETAGEETTTDEGEATTEEEVVEGPAADLEGTPHTVAEGESLFDIAERYGISWVDLADYNGIEDTSSVTAGITIVIPPTAGTGGVAEGEAAPEEETAAEEPAGDETVEETVAPTPSPAQETIYVVQPGDNLFRIGLRYGISWVQIAEANGIVNPNMIRAGQELKIPTSAPGPNPEFTHVVQPGETLFRIAIRYGVSWQAVAQRNQIRPPHIIYPGQTLIIPGNGSG